MRLHVVLISTLLILTAAALAEQRHYDRANGFSIEIPAQWSRTTDPSLHNKNSALTLHKGRLKVSVQALPGLTLEEIMKAYSEPFEETGASKTLDRATRINEVPGWITMWEIDQQSSSVMYMGLQSGKRGYALLGVFPPGSGEREVSEAVRLMTTFRVERGSVTDTTAPTPGPTKSPSDPIEVDQF